MFEILIIWAFIYFFFIKGKSESKKIYDINWKIINEKNRSSITSVTWKIFKVIWILFIIGVVLLWGCFLICVLSM